MYNTIGDLGSLSGKKKKKAAVKTGAPVITQEVPRKKSTPFSIGIGSIQFPLIAVLGILVVAGIIFTRRGA